MAIDIAVSVSMFFLEDALNLILMHSANLVRTLVNSRKRNRIVRQIGSHLTWIKARRLHIISREEFSEKPSSYDENHCLNSDCQCAEKPIEDGNYTLQLGTKVEELQRELFNLQSQVAKILLNQEKKLLNDEKGQVDFSSIENVVSSSSSMIPPPPPLPPTPVMHNKPFNVRDNSKAHSQVTEKNSVCSIMEELSNRPPKLRHVVLTPGGRPVRNVPVASNPSDVLRAVLRKRFEALHSP